MSDHQAPSTAVARATDAYNGDKIGQGKDKARNFLKENPDIAAEIDAKIREKLLPKESDEISDEASDETVEA